MTVYKVAVKSTFMVEADSRLKAKRIADKAIENLPRAEVSIKATKMQPLDFQLDETLR